jgi:hypothetical protein
MYVCMCVCVCKYIYISRYLRAELARVLPADAHERLNAWEGGVKIGVTLLRPAPVAVYIDTFESRQVVKALLRLCFKALFRFH